MMQSVVSCQTFAESIDRGDRFHEQTVCRDSEGFLYRKGRTTRAELAINREEIASSLLMATRTYIDLEQTKNCCSALTLALYLIYVCNDPLAFLNELRQALEAATIQAA